MRITPQNFVKQLLLLGKTKRTPELVEGIKFTTENLDLYDEDQDIKEAIDLVIEKLNAELEAKTASKSPAKKASTPKTVSQDEKPVFTRSPAVNLMQRFVRLVNKVVDRDKVRSCHAALQKAITLQQVNKSDVRFALLIRAKTALNSAFNNSNEGDSVKIEVDENSLTKMVLLAGGEKEFKSISIIKAYISLNGKTDETKAKALLARIKKSDFSTDPLFDKIEIITKALSSGKWRKLTGDEINGLGRLVRKCTNSESPAAHLMGFGGLGSIESPITGLEEAAKNLKESPLDEFTPSPLLPPITPGITKLKTRMSAAEVAAMEHTLLPFTDHWKELFGEPAKNFKMMFHGTPGSGKTTLLLQFAEYLAGLGKVLYATSEEYGAATLTQKVNELKISNIEFEPTIVGIDLNEFDFVFIDSINHMKINLDRFVQLTKEYPQVAFILVVQSTKDGDFRGGKDWEHEVDIAAKMHYGTATVHKNRFGTYGKYVLFEPKDNQGKR